MGATSYPTRELRELNLARIAAHLSHDVSAQLFRNLALSHVVLDAAIPQDAAGRDAWVDLPPPPPAQPPNWPSDQVRIAFGDVPLYLIDGPAAADEDEHAGEERFWGMFYFNPETSVQDESSVGVLNLWMSSERALSQAGCGHPVVSPSLFKGLSTTFNPVMFADAQDVAHDRAGPTLDHIAAGDDSKLARLARETKHAVRWILLDVLPPLFKRRGGGTLHLHGVSGVVEREAMALSSLQAAYRSACVLFHRPPTVPDLEAYAEARASGSLHGLRADYLKSTDLPTVQAENHIPFPLSYLSSAARISVCLRSDDGVPAAWVGTHRALTLASLHVTEPHRRTSGKANAGKDLVALYAARNWAALAPVLESLGITVPLPAQQEDSEVPGSGRAGHAHPASLLATTEASNPPGLRFFARMGWDAAPGASCWSAVIFPAEPRAA